MTQRKGVDGGENSPERRGGAQPYYAPEERQDPAGGYVPATYGGAPAASDSPQSRAPAPWMVRNAGMSVLLRDEWAAQKGESPDAGLLPLLDQSRIAACAD